MMKKVQKTKKNRISLVVPCFNEEESLPIFYRETIKVLKNNGIEYELIFVDDGSKDNTLNVVKDFSNKDKNVLYVSFSRNFGKEAAMYAGLKESSGDYVCIMDADMQDPPSLLPKMIEILKNDDYDSVATRRENRKGESKIRSWFAEKFYRIINKISDADIVNGARDFRLMKRTMVDSIISMTEYNRFSKGIFGWVGFKTYWLPFENVERVAGKTKWSFIGLFKYAINGIIDFSNVPLSISSFFGMFLTVIAFIILVFIIIRKLIFGDPVDGWASLMCAIIFIGGIQLFCIGIIGQYLGKTYMETKNRPLYFIRETNIENEKTRK